MAAPFAAVWGSATQAVGDDALEDTALVTQFPGHNARDTARSGRINNRSSETQTRVALTRAMEDREVWL